VWIHRVLATCVAFSSGQTMSSLVALESTWQGHYGEVVHVNVGATVRLQLPFISFPPSFLSPLLKFFFDLSKIKRCPIILFLYQIWFSFFWLLFFFVLSLLFLNWFFSQFHHSKLIGKGLSFVIFLIRWSLVTGLKG